MSTSYITAVVEGMLDETVLKRLCRESGIEMLGPYGKEGKAKIKAKINGYNNAAKRSHWLVLVDLDSEFQCAPEIIRNWLPSPSRYMNFRVAVREIESWLLADAEKLAKFLSVPKSRIPRNPDDVDNPKTLIVDLARRSRRVQIREDMVPSVGSGRKIGIAYTPLLMEFSMRLWRPGIAARYSDSLSRTIALLKRLVS